ncbi:unnamed protein product [Moneuplotes crassus]|uniref:Uncharacterized protein n=1 Tax=Euplotes crassus TaxID=5936 RepID=A0AAD1UFQ5_EUPCR|nr:unnamed protein product [Moneuplotes crassus]
MTTDLERIKKLEDQITHNSSYQQYSAMNQENLVVKIEFLNKENIQLKTELSENTKMLELKEKLLNDLNNGRAQNFAARKSRNQSQEKTRISRANLMISNKERDESQQKCLVLEQIIRHYKSEEKDFQNTLEEKLFVQGQIIAKKDVTIENWQQKFADLRVQYETILEQINSGKLGKEPIHLRNVIVEQPIIEPIEELIMYKCRDHCKISDFNELKEEHKKEMERFNNVKRYVTMLTDKIVKYKDVVLQFINITPKAKLKKNINLGDLNLDEDDPLLRAADQLSDPETPDVSARFNVKKNIKKDAKKQIKERERQKLQDYKIKEPEEKKEDPSEDLPSLKPSPKLSPKKEIETPIEQSSKEKSVSPRDLDMRDTRSDEMKSRIGGSIQRVKLTKVPAKIEEKETESSRTQKNVLFDDTSSDPSLSQRIERDSSLKQSSSSKKESLSERVVQLRQPQTIVKQIGDNKVVLRQLQPTKVVSNTTKPVGRKISSHQTNQRDKSPDSFTLSDNSQKPKNLKKSKSPQNQKNLPQNDSILEDLEEVLQSPQNPTPTSKSPVQNSLKPAPEPFQIDFNTIKNLKPQAEEIPTQKVTKIEFSAIPLTNPTHAAQERSLSEPAESSSHSIHKSDETPNTPPFSIRNMDLEYTQGKYKNVIPALDFNLLGKKKKKRDQIEQKKEIKPPTPEVTYYEEEEEEVEFEEESDKNEDKMFKPVKKQTQKEKKRSNKKIKAQGAQLKELPQAAKEPSLEELALESIGASTVDKRSPQDAPTKSNIKLSGLNIANQKDRTRGTTQSMMNKSKGSQGMMGSTMNSTVYNPTLNQPKKIVIKEQEAQKAREERERQMEAERTKKPEIYYKAHAELKEQKLREKIMKEKLLREKQKEEEEKVKAHTLKENQKRKIEKLKREKQERLKGKQDKLRKKEEEKYDPNDRLEVESSRSDEPYIEKDLKSESSEGEEIIIIEEEEEEYESESAEKPTTPPKEKRKQNKKSRLEKQKEDLLRQKEEMQKEIARRREEKERERKRERAIRLEEERRLRLAKEEKERKARENRQKPTKEQAKRMVRERQEEEKLRLDEMRNMELIKKKKEMEEKKLKTISMKKHESSSSSEESDSFPEDLPSSEKQRHMNPVSFVQKAEELVMQQIISNANFGPESPKNKSSKKNKPVLKQREEAMNSHKKDKRSYNKESKAVRKDRPLQPESLSEEYELIEEEEESESSDTAKYSPPPKKKKHKEFKI